ncbi:hypothetical protein V4D30_09245 [Thermodesulfovibrio sp. 3907-1M]|uniref:Transposase n=1 Tax=Thermodesulfovibrio autotrophicus TaxID=3118333 RepID=A0AAU8GYQ9_9BACT
MKGRIIINVVADLRVRPDKMGCERMKYNPDIHHRRSIRLKEYVYSQPGAYFVTIYTKNRQCLFGDVVDGEMILNDAGKMIEKMVF